MIARERLSRLQLHLRTPAILATVAIAREEEGVRHLAPEAARHVDELHEPDDRRARQREPLGADEAPRIALHDLRLAIEHETKRPTHGNHRQRLERRI